MSRLCAMVLAASLLASVVAGCNTDLLFARDKTKMGPIGTVLPPADKDAELILTPPASQEEADLIADVVGDRHRYREMVIRLRDYYHLKGEFSKRRWTEQELKGLQEIEPFDIPDYGGAGESVSEVDLVEQLAVVRQMYHDSLEQLRGYYAELGDPAKRVWIADEMDKAARIQKFNFLVDAEVPAEWLRPTDSIPAADALFERAKARMREGGHGIWALYREDIMLDALAMFRTLIQKYPTSDKIDDAAFYCGEIHKEYLKDQSEIAVAWYERAFTWDPQTPHAARFQAAVVTDYRMHNRARALELYHRVLKEETFNESNVSYAIARIEQLTRRKPEPETGATRPPTRRSLRPSG